MIREGISRCLYEIIRIYCTIERRSIVSHLYGVKWNRGCQITKKGKKKHVFVNHLIWRKSSSHLLCEPSRKWRHAKSKIIFDFPREKKNSDEKTFKKRIFFKDKNRKLCPLNWWTWLTRIQSSRRRKKKWMSEWFFWKENMERRELFWFLCLK